MDITTARRVIRSFGGESAEELKKLYKKALRKAHPDAGGSNEAYNDVQLAYKVLTEGTAGFAGGTFTMSEPGVYRHSSLFTFTKKKVG